jgi:TIR domain
MDDLSSVQHGVLQYWGRSNTHQHWFTIGLRFGQKFFNVAFCSYLHLQYFNWAAVPGGRFSNSPTSQSPIVVRKLNAKHYMRLTNCIITGIPITENNNGYESNVDGSLAFWYGMEINNERIVINVCKTLLNNYEYDTEIKTALDENKLIIIGDFLSDGMKKYQYHTFHWNCDLKGRARHINLKSLISEIKEKTDYPKTRKEKYDNLLKYLHNSQKFEGTEIEILKDIEFYGKLYFITFEELQFFLRELQRKTLIEYDEIKSIVQFTFYGLEYVDSLKISADFDMNMFSKASYQIGLSFAGEDRAYVEEVAEELKRKGISVFYDIYEQVDLWGKDLYQHLNDVYKNKCEYCVIFISENYSKKLWTLHELKSAQTKAFNENKEYILPVRFDNTEIPGMNSTVGYLDCNKITPLELATFAAKKVEKKA